MPQFASELSAAIRVASLLLRELHITEPPLEPEAVLARLSLTVHELPLFDRQLLTPDQRRVFSSVRALLSPTDGRIYLSRDLPSRQHPWAIYHEAGHATIEWHHDLLYLDNEYSLSAHVRDQMEREANEFAGHLLFLGSRFEAEAHDLPFGLETAVHLSHRYNASFESTFRRYVATCATPCICNVFQVVHVGAYRGLKYQYFVKPAKIRRLWELPCAIGEMLPYNHEWVRLINKEGFVDGTVYEHAAYQGIPREDHHHQLFSNGHSVFVLTLLEVAP